jgi:hypothetical protein
MTNTGMDMYVSENIHKLSDDFDVPIDAIKSALECNIFAYLEKHELRYNIEVFFD